MSWELSPMGSHFIFPKLCLFYEQQLWDLVKLWHLPWVPQLPSGRVGIQIQTLSSLVSFTTKHLGDVHSMAGKKKKGDKDYWQFSISSCWHVSGRGIPPDTQRACWQNKAPRLALCISHPADERAPHFAKIRTAVCFSLSMLENQACTILTER
jgi:hypothetical protein